MGSPTTKPTAWPPMKAGHDLGVIDANVSVKDALLVLVRSQPTKDD